MPSLTSLLFVVCALCAPLEAYAQPLEGGARSAALGGAGAALAGDAWGRSNPAVRGSIQRPQASIFASQGYGMAELRLAAAAVALPSRIGTIALGGQTFGFDAYRENRFFAGYAHGFRIARGRYLYGGIDLHYEQIRIQDYGSTGLPLASIGAVAQVLPVFWVGASMLDLHARKDSDTLPVDRRVVFGFLYQPDSRVRAVLDIDKPSDQTFSIRSGVELLPVEAVAFRAGVATAPVRITTGAGFRVGLLSADVAVEHHDVLGWTPGLSIGVEW